MIFYTTIIFSLLFDIITKYLASTFLVEQINIFSNFLYLKYTLNSWIAFWIELPFLKIITLFLIFWIFCYYIIERKKIIEVKIISLPSKKIFDFSFWLILGWAIWNAIERIFFGEVTDFIWVKYFAIFNIADSLIFIWTLLYIIYLLKE